jgi:hypothetical protein
MVMRMNDQITIQDVFHQFLPEYCETHNFSEVQHLAAFCISNCRTAEMGANVSECEVCRKRYIHYNSCRNRHCPMCQGMDVDEWIDRQQENVLDVPYFHTVFTIPKELYPLVYSNQKLLYDALYHAAHQALAELSADPKHLGARIGYICVLHTWGSRMNYHPHLHTIVLGGGLDKCNKWKDKGEKFFFPIRVMSAVFKKYYLRELKELWSTEKLEYHGTSDKYRNHYTFKELLDDLYKKEWIVYIKKAFNGAGSVIKYLGRYTHRIAISNRRIISMTKETVTYLAKDYKNGGKMIPYTVRGVDFLRMFLMHVLPKGFVRIRHYGLLSCRNKKEKMSLCRELLNSIQYISRLRGKTTAEKLMILYQKDICKCDSCGGKLLSFRFRGRGSLT